MSKEEALKDKGLKVTLPRMRVLEVLMSSPKRHLSAEDVHSILVHKGLKGSLATVYRVLSQFEESGIVHRVQFETGISVYEINDRDEHDHIVCLDCGHVEEFYNKDFIAMQNKIAMSLNYSLKRHCNVLAGICKKCQKKSQEI